MNAFNDNDNDKWDPGPFRNKITYRYGRVLVSGAVCVIQRGDSGIPVPFTVLRTIHPALIWCFNRIIPEVYITSDMGPILGDLICPGLYDIHRVWSTIHAFRYWLCGSALIRSRVDHPIWYFCPKIALFSSSSSCVHITSTDQSISFVKACDNSVDVDLFIIACFRSC